MTKAKTEPSIQWSICERLRCWHRDLLPTPVTTSFPGAQQAIQSQDEIGWQNFLEGLPSIYWQGAQQTYYEWLGMRRTGKRWMAQLISKTQDIAWDQWQHRNSVLHDKDRRAVPPRLAEEIRREHHRGREALPLQDHIHFRQTLEELQAAPVRVQLSWLANVRAARKRNTRRQETTYASERNRMQIWLAGEEPP